MNSQIHGLEQMQNGHPKLEKRSRRLNQFRTVTLIVFLVLPLGADEKPPAFFFGGKEIYVGMPKPDAVKAIATCCTLSPPADSGGQDKSVVQGVAAGHFILPKGQATEGMLGAIYFSEGRVAKVTRPLADGVDTFNEDLVGFARAIKRSLATEAGESERTAVVSVRHEKMGNAESDVILLKFQDGRGIEVHVGTLDKINPETNKRDFATLDETLDPSR